MFLFVGSRALLVFIIFILLLLHGCNPQLTIGLLQGNLLSLHILYNLANASGSKVNQAITPKDASHITIMCYKRIMGFKICQLTTQVFCSPALVSRSIASIDVQQETIATLISRRINIEIHPTAVFKASS